jgi:hypothetical protein
MGNIAEGAQNISTALTNLLDGGVGRQLPKAGKDRLLEAKALADQLYTSLVAINDQVITLEETPTDTGKEARDVWQRLQPGPIKGDSRAFQQLRERSETLTELYKAGIDITEIYKLSPKQIDISKRIGAEFGRFHRVWDRFKLLTATKDHPAYETKAEVVDETERFFRILRDTGVITAFKIQLLRARDEWVDCAVDRVRRADRRNPVRVCFSMDRSYCALLNGHWFNGYVYEVLCDQLRRMDVDYELYPLVKYRCDGNAALARGEFDILARIGRQRLVVECKSGRLQANGRNDFPMLMETERALEHRFAATRLTRGLFILVYNPFLTRTEDVDQELATSDIRTIPITDMRGRVIDLAQELAT